MERECEQLGGCGRRGACGAWGLRGAAAAARAGARALRAPPAPAWHLSPCTRHPAVRKVASVTLSLLILKKSARAAALGSWMATGSYCSGNWNHSGSGTVRSVSAFARYSR